MTLMSKQFVFLQCNLEETKVNHKEMVVELKVSSLTVEKPRIKLMNPVVYMASIPLPLHHEAIKVSKYCNDP